MDTPKLEPGAVAVTRSGGPNMLVTEVVGNRVSCVRVIESRVLDEASYDADALTVVRQASK